MIRAPFNVLLMLITSKFKISSVEQVINLSEDIIAKISGVVNGKNSRPYIEFLG